MRYTVPDYYKQFVCLAGKCPATCCAGWQIVIDPKSLKKYKHAKRAFGNRLKNSVDWKNGVFYQYGRRCAFLNDDNLCDMHIEAGKDMMCSTCRKYPRHIEEFENEREITLSMSCPAAARLILEKKTPVKFLTSEDSKKEKSDEEFDFFLYSALQDSRNVMIKMLQNRKISIYLRMAQILALAGDLQNRIRAGRIFEMEEVLVRYQKEGAGERLFAKIKKEQPLPAEGLLNLLDWFEVLDAQWAMDVNVWKRCAQLQNPSKTDEIEAEQMAIYFLMTYFCGAVYDGNALSKVKMTVVSVLLWEEICRAFEAQQGRQVTFEERVELAYRYSRELEHSDQNLNQMEELMDTQPEAQLHSCLGYLVQRMKLL